ncbi:MAG: hypothetical protein FWG94_11745 [Oscillospiraceae bacterium]|nr:hypothetical protein [Oscillospiraceae bacterium]
MKLSNSAKKILNDPLRIEQRDQWFSRLQNLFDGKKTDNVMAINGVCGSPEDDTLLYSYPEQWVVESLENLAEKIDARGNDVQFILPCIEPGIFGVHFIDSIFGSHVYFEKESNQWYNEYLNTEIGTLRHPDLEKSEAWNLATRATNEFLKQEVELPLFGLPTIASALNIAVNLYGENILAEMLIDPDNAACDLSVINHLLAELHYWYRSVLPEKQLQPVISWQRTQPSGYGQICGCTTQLISAEVYDTQIAIFDNELLGVYPNGGMIHLCGSHSHLIPSFRSMQNLKALQLNDCAARDLALYFNGLREDQILYLMPCDGMPTEKAIEITGGNRLVIQAALSDA